MEELPGFLDFAIAFLVEHGSYLVALIDDDVGEVLHACLEALGVVAKRKRHADRDARLADLDMRVAAVVDAGGVLLAGIAVEVDLLLYDVAGVVGRVFDINDRSTEGFA